MQDGIEKLLYENRLPPNGDIEVFLWYKCSMNCAFCKQPHDDIEGMTIEAIKEKSKEVVDFIKEAKAKEFTVTILGGEIFDDSVSDRILDAVYHMFLNIEYGARCYGKKVNFENSTNLMFTDAERVWRFFKYLKVRHDIDVKLCISYDIADRFTNQEQRNVFSNNETVLKDYINIVSFVMSKKTVKTIIEGFNDPYFTYLYKKYRMSFSQYNDNEPVFEQLKRTLTLRPDEPDFLEAVKILADEYPKIDVIQKWAEQAWKEQKSHNPCGKDKIVILPSGSEVRCVDAIYCNGCTAREMAQDRNCLSCKYFGYCQVECFEAALDKRIKKIQPCLQQAIYNHLKEIPL